MAARWVRVILMSSASANMPFDMIYYGATKTADPETVNAMVPGPTLSEGACASCCTPSMEVGKGAGESRGWVRDGATAEFHHPPRRRLRGSGQARRLCRVAAGIGDHRRRSEWTGAWWTPSPEWSVLYGRT
jgi:hypothetical protein